MKEMSKEKFLHIAKSRIFSVHKYKDSHSNQRKQGRRYEKEGLVSKEERFGCINYSITDKGNQWLKDQ